MKSGSRFQCAVAGLVLVVSAFSYVLAQTPSATPDPFIAQLTSVPAGFYAFAGDLTANGRFVVFESNGNLDTQNPRNADANREIYILDYAQRRIFQLTNTKNVQKPPASPTPTPTPTATPTPAASPTPTPTPIPTPADPAQIKIEISSNRPVITSEPALTAGRRTYTIVFSSNAPAPGDFDGTDSAALVADGNQEVWIYQLPEVDDTFDLSTGDELPLTDLTTGAFRRITDTPPSRPLRTGVNPPDALDDNREATISDDGRTLAFISSRNVIPGGNTDGNAELFLVRSINSFVTNTFVQVTNTQDDLVGVKTFPRYQQNPSLSANGGVVAFLSTATNIPNNVNNDDGAGHGNEEVFAVNFSGSALSNFRQVTKTKSETSGGLKGVTMNLLSLGRRLSRDGSFIAFQSRAEDPAANTGTNANFLALFVSTVPTDASTAPVATKVGPRDLDIINFPTFTDYDGALVPHTLVWGSAQNFKPDGTAATTEAEGLNPVPAGNLRPGQVFTTQFPITASNTFTRLTKVPVTGFVSGIRPLASASKKRIAFSLDGIELGGGNGAGDFSPEVFYMLTPTVSVQASEALSFFTGASNMGPMSSADPGASPSPTPTPSPSPGVPLGLSPGELSKVRSTVGLATSDKNAVGGSETARRPILPIELNGVSLSVNGSAAGLYFVGDSPAEGISFVNPIGLSIGTATVAVHDQKNSSPTSWRGFVQIVASQPDIFTSTNDAGGVAMVCNVTNTAISGCVTGPFQVTTADSTGAQKPTRLEIYVTGLRAILNTETKVSFVNGTTTTDITPLSVRSNINMFGTDLITIELPSTLAGMAPIDYKIIVTVTRVSVFTSRAADTAATVTINPGP